MDEKNNNNTNNTNNANSNNAGQRPNNQGSKHFGGKRRPFHGGKNRPSAPQNNGAPQQQGNISNENNAPRNGNTAPVEANAQNRNNRPNRNGGQQQFRRPQNNNDRRNNNNNNNNNANQQQFTRPDNRNRNDTQTTFQKPDKAETFTIPVEDFGFFDDITPKIDENKYTFTEEELNEILEEKAPVDDGRPRTEVIGIRFKKVGKMYYFDPAGITLRNGDSAIVETARGIEFGQVCLGNTKVLSADVVLPLRPVIRTATPEDIAHNNENAEKEAEAFRVCLEKINEHGLDMKLVDAQYTFDNSKLVFYFTSAGRVDFRDLVKDLASIFRIRIDLRQIGIRDEAKQMGGLGICGRPLCCASFLSDFVQVSIKMAKEQSLSLNSAKISGTCGRLMCCLRYEYNVYQDEISRTPPVESVVDTPDGRGTVVDIYPIAGKIKVRLNDKEKQETVYRQYKRDLCTVVSRPPETEEKNK